MKNDFQSRSRVDLVAIVSFDGSASLSDLLRARGLRVKVVESLSAAIAALHALHTAVLVVPLPLESCDHRRLFTFVIRNFGTLGVRQELFHDRFAEFFSGPVDPTTLCAAVIRHAMASDAADRRPPGQVA